MTEHLALDVISGDRLGERDRAALLGLCSRAYETDFEPLFQTFAGATHVLARQHGAVVSHALWVTRWLQAGDGPLLRTAYVEAVATEPAYQRRGLATAVMRRLAEAIADQSIRCDFDLGALSPSDDGFYVRLGWETWRGPLSIRTATGSMPTPEDRVMILCLPGTPDLDLDAPLSAEWRDGELW